MYITESLREGIRHVYVTSLQYDKQPIGQSSVPAAVEEKTKDYSKFS